MMAALFILHVLVWFPKFEQLADVDIRDDRDTVVITEIKSRLSVISTREPLNSRSGVFRLDTPFREAVLSHLDFGSRVAQQNSRAKTDAERHPIREVPKWRWPD